MFYTINLRKQKRWMYIGGIICILILVARYILIPSILYPTPYKEIVEAYAAKYELDPHLIYAVMRAESRYNPGAESHKGAKGLMQLIGTTASWGADELGIESFTESQIFEPEMNIRIGVWYLHKLMQQYKGDYVLVLAAYNAGSGNVSKWLGNEEYSRDGKSLHHIPFRETREYVKKVLKNLRYYQKLYS